MADYINCIGGVVQEKDIIRNTSVNLLIHYPYNRQEGEN